MRSLRSLAAAVLLSLPLFAACGDGGKKPDAGPPVPSAIANVKPAPIESIAPPASVIAWAGADSLEKLSGGVQAFLQQVMPLAPSVLDLAKDELRRKLSLTKLDGVDFKRPARVAVFDPKGMPKAAYAVVVGLSSKEQLLAALPPTKKENDEGNAITYRDDLGRTICMSFVDDSVVITWDKKQWSQNIDFLVQLARSTVTGEQAFYLSASNVSALYTKEIDEMVVEAKQQMAASPMGVPGAQGETSNRVLQWMVSTFKELERVESRPTLLEDGALLRVRLFPKEGTELARSFKAIEARPHVLLGKLPADAPVFASFSTNPDAVDGLTTRLVEWAMSVGFGGKVPEGYAELMKDYFQSTNGEMAMAVHKPFTGEGLSLTTLLSVRDEEKLRAAMRKSKDTFKDKAILENMKKMGISIEYKEGAYKIGAVPVDTAEVKFDKEKNPFAQLGPFGEAMGELQTNHTAVSKDLAIIGYGKDARKALEGFLDGKVQGGLDKAAGPVRALRVGVKDPVAILYVSPVEVAKRASLGGKNPLAEGLKDLASTTGVALSFTAKDGVFELVLDLPVEQARNGMQAASRARAMFQQ